VTLSELLSESVGETMSNETTELINSIHSVSQSMIRLLDDTLNFAGTRTGMVQLRTGRFHVSEIIEQSTETRRPLAAKKNIHLDFVQDGEPLPVMLDAAKISNVFNILIDNAIQCCQPGAKIAIRISRSSEIILVSVRGEGPGIDASAVASLFNPFQRTRSRALDVEHGTGLGLATARDIVQLHGGRMYIKTGIGKGTTFYVSLPVQSH